MSSTPIWNALRFTNDALTTRAYRAPDGSSTPNELLETLRSEDAGAEIDLLDGYPLEAQGRFAAMDRRPAEGDLRANVSVGGHATAVEMDDRLNRITDAIGPRLRRDGLFFTGIDVIGDKLVEVNGICPGALEVVQESAGVDFAAAIIRAVEERVETRSGPALSPTRTG